MNKKTYVTVFLSLFVFCENSFSEKYKVVVEKESVIVDWKFVEGWKSQEIEGVFGKNVDLRHSSYMPSRPIIMPKIDNPEPVPINPWCECPEEDSASIIKKIQIFEPMLLNKAEIFPQVRSDIDASFIGTMKNTGDIRGLPTDNSQMMAPQVFGK